MALVHGHGRKHLDLRASPLDHGGSHENGVQRRDQPIDVEVGFERVALAPERVPAYGNIDDAEVMLVRPAVEDVSCEQDHAGACPEGGHALSQSFG